MGTYFKYEWRVFSRALHDTRRFLFPKGQAMIRGAAFAILSGLLGLAFYVAVWGVDQALQDELKILFAKFALGVPVGAVGWFFVVFIIFCLLAPSRIQKESDDEIDGFENRIKNLTTPRIEICLGSNHPYRHDGPYLGIPYKRLWRIGVKNLCKEKSIEEVQLEIKEIRRPEGRNALFPVRLRLMDDDPTKPSDPDRHGFVIHPDKEIHFDFVGLEFNSGDTTPFLVFCYWDKFRPNTIDVEPVYPFSDEGFEIQEKLNRTISPTEVLIDDPWWPLQSYDITIQASGRNVPSAYRDFKIEITKEWELLLIPLGDCYSDATS